MRLRKIRNEHAGGVASATQASKHLRSLMSPRILWTFLGTESSLRNARLPYMQKVRILQYKGLLLKEDEHF